ECADVGGDVPIRVAEPGVERAVGVITEHGDVGGAGERIHESVPRYDDLPVRLQGDCIGVVAARADIGADDSVSAADGGDGRLVRVVTQQGDVPDLTRGASRQTGC